MKVIRDGSASRIFLISFVSDSLSWNSILFMLVSSRSLGHNSIAPAAACMIMSASRDVMQASLFTSAARFHPPLAAS